MTEAERSDLKKEVPSPEYSLCPNITEFIIQGQYWGEAWLELSVWPNEKIDKEFDGWFTVF